MIDLFKEWDEDSDGTVSKAEFRKAMPILGLAVPRREVDELFDSWDLDGSGALDLKVCACPARLAPASRCF